MPLSKYDKYFGGKGGAEKAAHAIQQEYGNRWKGVFYGLKNKRKGKTLLSKGS